MKILYDIASAQSQGNIRTNGGGEYCVTILSALLQNAEQKEVCILKNKIYGNCKKAENLAIQYNCKVVYYSCVDELNTIINEAGCDIVIFPVCYPSYQTLKINESIRIISVIHDLCDIYNCFVDVRLGRYIELPYWQKITEKLKFHLRKQIRLQRSIDNHKKLVNLNNHQDIVTVSKFTKNELIKYLDLTENQVHVFYTPEKTETIKDTENIFKIYPIKKNYFFFLMAGSRWAKNNALVIKTFDNMLSKEKYRKALECYKVVLVGLSQVYKNFYYKLVRNKEFFIFDDYVDDSVLVELYKNAHAFIFPSVLEGFGMPPIESMKLGTVPICSTAMSIPEVCGNAALYFDPHDMKSIKQAVLKSLADDTMEKLRAEGFKQYNYLSNKRDTDLKNFISFIMNGKNKDAQSE